MKQLCKILRDLSQETWQRIQFARSRKGLKIYETTITQNLLFELHRQGSNNLISIFEAIDEKTNGNDIELYIPYKTGFIFLPTQSKIIYKGGNYPRMEHGDQIKDLIQYANQMKGIPLYLLYNFIPNVSLNNVICGITCTNEDYGCSVIGAKFLLNTFAYKRKDKNGNQKWNIPDFNDLHPYPAFPWFLPFCCDLSTDEKQKKVRGKFFSNFFGSDFDEVKIYSKGELEENKDWSPINFDKEAIGSELKVNKSNDSDLKIEELNNKTFSPKFRVIFQSND